MYDKMSKFYYLLSNYGQTSNFLHLTIQFSTRIVYFVQTKQWTERCMKEQFWILPRNTNKADEQAQLKWSLPCLQSPIQLTFLSFDKLKLVWS